MIDPRRLRVLYQLAQHRTVAATAEALHLTGPGVSQHLAALERETGTQLLEKRGRTLELTAAGQLLVAHAEIVLDDLATAQAALDALAEGGIGTVRVAAFSSAARVLLPPAWAALRAGGGVELRLAELEPASAVAALLHGSADLAVVHGYSLLPQQTPARCAEHHLLNEPVLLALQPELATAHGLAPGAAAELAEFAGQPWLAPKGDMSCRELAARACGAAGFVPDVVAEANDFAVLTALVAAGAGVALVPRMALPDVPPAISLHPLSRPVHRTVVALSRAGTARRPAVRRVLDELSAAATAHDGQRG